MMPATAGSGSPADAASLRMVWFCVEWVVTGSSIANVAGAWL